MDEVLPTEFSSLLLEHLFDECPHVGFDDLTTKEKEEYNEALNLIRKHLTQGEPFDPHPTDAFGQLLHSRLETFSQMEPTRLTYISASTVEGEAVWYRLMRWCTSTYVHSTLRRIYVRYYSWGVLCAHAIEVIQRYSPVLEVGAGNGYWAYELAKRGVNVVATDNFSDLVDDLSPLR
eukprot:TRINITY_DN4131_c0_g1_i3.p2 TRINITY_DN4131_c0_g1~~TRINITY_DN4131_c0_g1_i3.p2  ORF type:complete len:177 (-),score=18.56 TRINITY_DN4131_c0_g1_i3:882-1412(-)